MCNQKFSLVILLSVLSISASAQLPLFQIDQLQYEGAFIIPPDTYGESSSNYAAGTFTLSADNAGFFIAGHNVEGAIAEFAIPAVIPSDSLQDLNYATIRQPFVSLMDNTPDGNPQNINRVAGMEVVDGRLLVNAVEYYDAPADNTHTTLVVEDATDMANSAITGYYHVSGEAHAGGWISDVPASMQSELGGAYLMGNSSKYPINGRSAMGVSAFVFDPADLTGNDTDPIPSTLLLDYDLGDPLYADYSSYDNAHYNLIEVNGDTGPGHTFDDADAVVGGNALWTSSSQASYGFIVPGTRTYFTIGSSGGHNSGIGYKATQNNGNLCGGPCPYDADDVYNYYWLWDMDDLLDVKNGLVSPYDVRPYDYGVFEAPLQYDDYNSEPEMHAITGGDFDGDNGILYLTLFDGGATGSQYQRNPAVLAYSLPLMSSLGPPTLALEEIHNGLTQPVKIANAGDGSNRLFVAEKTGKIKVIESNDTVLSAPFLDIGGIITTNSERGLLGLAFHPDYETNGYFYVNYNDASGDTQIARYSVSANPNIADANSGTILLSYDQPHSNHNGGDINFGPQDGYLYIASGDGGSSNDPGCEAQDSLSRLGKLLRIDVDATGNLAPVDNPFVGNSNADDNIWALGLRNPWRFSFDRETGDMWLADVGQNEIEEVDYDPAPLTGGINYGWKYMEGTLCLTTNVNNSNCTNTPPPCNSPLYQDPVFEYTHDFTTGGSSITGGYVYRGCKYTAMQGLYICADYSSGNFWTVDNTGDNTIHSFLIPSVTTFGEDEQGELYCATIQGRIYKVKDTSFPEVLTLTSADAPLEGEYRAYEKIIVEGNITVADDQTATLIAPEVIIKDQLTAEINENIVIRNDSCE